MKKILLFIMAMSIVLGSALTIQAAEGGDKYLSDKLKGLNQEEKEYLYKRFGSMTLQRKNEALFDAVGSDDPEEVEILLAVGADKDAKNEKGETPFYRALRRGGRSIDILLDAGVDLETHPKGAYYDNLCFAISSKKNDALKKMLDAGMSVNRKYYDLSETPLRIAIRLLNSPDGFDTVAILINAGANTDWLGINEKNRLMEVAFMVFHNYGVSIIEKVLRLGVSLEKIEENQKTKALFDAIRQKNLYVAQALLNAGISFSKEYSYFYNKWDYPDDDSEVQFWREHKNDTPLIFAEKIGNTEIVKAIKQKQLFDAIEGNDLSLFQIALEKGADIQSRDLRGVTPLHVAAKVGNADAIQTLLGVGADIHATDRFGNTPFGVAAYEMNVVLDKKNRIPEDKKRAETYQTILQMLIDAELKQAVKEDNPLAVELLFKGGKYLHIKPSHQVIEEVLSLAKNPQPFTDDEGGESKYSVGYRRLNAQQKEERSNEVMRLLTESIQKK